MARTVTALGRWVRYGLFAISMIFAPIMAQAAPYAALVMDMRTGEVLYSKNADTRLHPASLTKMMTLYITFQAIERGEISLDTKVTVSANAASQPPSRLGLKPGQKIAVRYLIRAAAIKSANDAASALGDAISGNESNFAARMNRTAKALGMSNTSFRNANGLTRAGHLSTARDMTLLGRRLFYDFPQYYNIFSRKTADAGIAQVANTNRRFLSAYEGADGIKTGYTSAAGFNLTASAKRGNKRIIATVFGGTSTAQRNAKMAELLDLGFGRAPSRVKERAPEAPQLLAEAAAPQQGSAKTIRLVRAPKSSPRPLPRPGVATHDADAIALALAAAQADAAAQKLAEAVVADVTVQPEAVAAAAGLAASPRPMARPGTIVAAAPPAVVTEVEAVELAEATLAPEPSPEPNGFIQSTEPQPETLTLAAAVLEDESMAEGDAVPNDPIFARTSVPQPETLAMAAGAPPSRAQNVILAALTPPAPAPRQKQQVVARASSSGGRGHGISLGLFASNFAAERALLTTALMESDTLGDALRKVATRKTGYEANFVGMSRDTAELACARLAARATDCTVIGP